jgi:dUTP pyrophosphatase
MNLKICKTYSDAIVPKYATDGAACFDLHAITERPVEILGPNETLVVRTGLAFEVPDGHVLMVFSRSGHGFKHGVRLVNGTGIIDSDYRGEVLIGLHNDRTHESFDVRTGDRVAQAMLVPVPRVTFHVVEQLSITDRGAGGFGSTGAV